MEYFNVVSAEVKHIETVKLKAGNYSSMYSGPFDIDVKWHRDDNEAIVESIVLKIREPKSYYERLAPIPKEVTGEHLKQIRDMIKHLFTKLLKE